MGALVCAIFADDLACFRRLATFFTAAVGGVAAGACGSSFLRSSVTLPFVAGFQRWVAVEELVELSFLFVVALV